MIHLQHGVVGMPENGEVSAEVGVIEILVVAAAEFPEKRAFQGIPTRGANEGIHWDTGAVGSDRLDTEKAAPRIAGEVE